MSFVVCDIRGRYVLTNFDCPRDGSTSENQPNITLL